MACITILTIENISGDTSVLRVHLRLRVACRALKYLVVGRIGVAGGTDPSRVSVARREPRVVECRPGPGCSAVTRFTCRGISRRTVIGIRRAVILRRVTCIASTVRKRVIPVCVAGLACCGDVCSRQGKFRCAVVKRCRPPGSSRVTRLADLTEISCRVIRIRGSLEIAGVALVTI